MIQLNMKKSKKNILEKNGWKVSNADEFLKLSAEESALIEMKLTLSQNLRQLRLKRNLSQKELAALLESSQSRVAKMEAGDSSVTLDLLLRSLLSLGSSRKAIAKMLEQ